MTDAPERTPLSCDQHDWYSSPHGNQRLDRCPWCEVVALEQERDAQARLIAAHEKDALHVEREHRFEVERLRAAMEKALKQVEGGVPGAGRNVLRDALTKPEGE